MAKDIVRHIGGFTVKMEARARQQRLCTVWNAICNNPHERTFYYIYISSLIEGMGNHFFNEDFNSKRYAADE